MTRLDLYWLLRALPTKRLERVVEILADAREGGWVVKALCALNLATETIELALVPRHVTEHLVAAGYQQAPFEAAHWLLDLAKAAPDMQESGRAGSDGSLHTWRSTERGILVAEDGSMVGGRMAWTLPDVFRAWAHRHLWPASGIIDMTLLANEGFFQDTAQVVVAPADRPPTPVPTSNPSAADLAHQAETTGCRSPVLLLAGPSGCGKSITAVAIASVLRPAARTIRLSQERGSRTVLLLYILELLRPDVVVLDDMPLADAAHGMRVLEQVHATTSAVVVVTLMYEGSPEDLRLPGLRPGRVDVLAFFHAPTEDDRLRVLQAQGLYEALARRLARDPRAERWTCAYLVAAAERLRRGADYDRTLDDLRLQRQVATHDAPELVGTPAPGVPSAG